MTMLKLILKDKEIKMKDTVKIYLEKELEKIVNKLGYKAENVVVQNSSRPEMADFQSNIAFQLAKQLNKNPLEVAGEIAKEFSLKEFLVEVAPPAYINFKFTEYGLNDLAKTLAKTPNYGIEMVGKGKTVVVDYGGANIAKELHMGHLRAPIIGEAVSRIHKLFGYKTVGDVHLGDWGLQMGLIMAILDEQGDLDYYYGKTDKKPNITLDFLNENYPKASARSKVDENFKKKADELTLALQQLREPYYTIWKDIRAVSIKAIEKNYNELNCNFDLWFGESDAEKYIKPTVQRFIDLGLTEESEGATIVKVARDGEHLPIPKKNPDDPNERQLYKNPMPPVVLKKYNGGDLYATTDIATIMQRVKDNKNLDKIIYVVDKRQGTHFTQVFRASKMSGIAPENLELVHVGYGTMNGKDGKPFKTRSGDTIKLQDIIDMVSGRAHEKLTSNGVKNADAIALDIGVGAMKFGDLSNEVYRDYVFDLDAFMSFEGKTGPYIQYTAVRIKSLLQKAGEFKQEFALNSTEEKNLILEILKMIESFRGALNNYAPHMVCSSLYSLASSYSTFYNNNRILTEKDERKRNSYLSLSKLVLTYLEKACDILAIKIPDRM